MGMSLPPLTCRDCGRPITRHGRTGRLIHRSGGPVAACDLDGDHVPRPDWRAVGPVSCAICHAAAHADGSGELTHVDHATDADHRPDPWD